MFDVSTQSPFVVLWRVMDTCNLECPFCAYDKRLKFPRSVIDTAHVIRMIDVFGALQTSQSRPVLVSWLGGEPTLWADFEKVTDHAAQAGLMQSLTTNGTTLGSAMLRARLAAQFDEVTISVDALGARHEDLRGWNGGFAKLAKWVPQLAQDIRDACSETRLRANVVLMHDTLPQFDELCETLADWGITQITFNQLGGRDRPQFFPTNRLTAVDAEHLSALLPDLRRRLGLRGVKLLGGDPYVGRIVDSAHDVALEVSSCQVAQNFLFIDEKGQIAPCAFVEDHFGVSVADILTAAQLAAVPDHLCQSQQNCPHDACANCMSTQQFSKFDS